MNRANILWCNKDSSIVTWNLLFDVDPGFRSFARGKGGGRHRFVQEAGCPSYGAGWFWLVVVDVVDFTRLHVAKGGRCLGILRSPALRPYWVPRKITGPKLSVIVMKSSCKLKAEWLCRCVSWPRKKEHAASCPLFPQDLGDKLLVIVNNDMQARTYETIFPYHISMLGGSMQIIQIWKAAQKKGQPFMPGAWWWWHRGNKVCKDIQITKVKRYKQAYFIMGRQDKAEASKLASVWRLQINVVNISANSPYMELEQGMIHKISPQIEARSGEGEAGTFPRVCRCSHWVHRQGTSFRNVVNHGQTPGHPFKHWGPSVEERSIPSVIPGPDCASNVENIASRHLDASWSAHLSTFRIPNFFGV